MIEGKREVQELGIQRIPSQQPHLHLLREALVFLQGAYFNVRIVALLILASIFAIPVFPLPQRDPKKLYVIALDLARELGMRDSYTLFHRNVETLTKLWASEDEKNWLSSLGLIASNIRHRDISLVEVGQAIKKYAVNLAKPGISISRLEHFIENPVISDILTVAEFEGMKSYGLVPEGFSPSFDSEHPKDIHIPVFDTPPNKRTKIATATSSDSLAEHFSDPACSQLLTRAIAEASDYNRWLVMYRASIGKSS